jgi:hypothetical protein
LAVVLDVGSYYGHYSANRDRIPGYYSGPPPM